MTISRMGGSGGATTPAWLYELLPFIYLGAGFGVFVGLSGILAALSGTLFVAAGIQVLLMRSSYRKSFKPLRRAPARARRYR